MATADPALTEAVHRQFANPTFPVARGMVWTTDAPFRETAAALAVAREAGALAVEMEAAALYALGKAKQRAVVCFAHVTNSMAVEEGDFEKGPSDGAEQALEVVRSAAAGWQVWTTDAGH